MVVTAVNMAAERMTPMMVTMVRVRFFFRDCTATL